MKIKVGTYNVCHCGDYSKHKEGDPFQLKVLNIEQTANAIKSLGCDVIGLNEVYNNGTSPREEFKFQTEKLARFAGYPYYYYAQGHDYETTDIGNAILSKYPIKKFEAITIPTVPESEREQGRWYENRVLAIADVDFNGTIVKIIETHFGLIPIELERIVKKSCEVIDGATDPVILMGDLNVQPDNPALTKIEKRLKSCAKEMNNDEFTFASYNPKVHIDYIYVPKSSKVLSYEVHKLRASDHMPISAEIEL